MEFLAMGKGGYNGGGTVIGPRDQGWYGKGDRPHDPLAAAKPPTPLPQEVEQEIAGLRRSISALENRFRAAESDLEGEKRKLEELLKKYGQPPL